MSYNTLVVLFGVGMLGGVAGLVGAFAVLRRRALLGDALSHAALPGLCLGFLVAQERNLPAMLFGALLTGLLGIALVAYLRQRTIIREDAAIGIVLSVFFGAGIVLSRLIQNSTTLEGSKAGLDSYVLGKTAGMVIADAELIALVALIASAVVVVLFKEFLLISFDPAFAVVQGWPSWRLDLALTGLLAVVVVVGIPAVGVVLMAALLIIPGVSARFWSDRLAIVVGLSAAFGVVVGLVGTAISASFDRMPAGPVITLVSTGIFVLSALAAPRRGLVARMLIRQRDRWHGDYAELLRLLFERRDPPSSLDNKAWPSRRLRRLIAHAVRQGHLVVTASGRHDLTPAGTELAREWARRNHLWRLLVLEYPDLSSLARPWSDERIEDYVSSEVLDALTSKLPPPLRSQPEGGRS